MYHAGRTEDLRAVIRTLADEPEARDNPSGEPLIAVMGFSLGGAATIKLIGEPLDGVPVFAGIAVSAPLELAVGAQHLQRMLFGAYDRYLLSSLRKELLRPPAGSGPLVSENERVAIRAARSIEDFDDAVTSLRNGWQDAAQYYAVNSSGQFLASAGVPLLVIHSLDDPMIPAQPYLDVDWLQLANGGLVERADHCAWWSCGFSRTRETPALVRRPSGEVPRSVVSRATPLQVLPTTERVDLQA